MRDDDEDTDDDDDEDVNVDEVLIETEESDGEEEILQVFQTRHRSFSDVFYTQTSLVDHSNQLHHESFEVGQCLFKCTRTFSVFLEYGWEEISILCFLF